MSTTDASQIHDLRSALDFLREMPGQLLETDTQVDPDAEVSGVYRHVGAGGTVMRPTKEGPAMVFNNVKGFDDAKVCIGMLASRKRVAALLDLDGDGTNELVIAIDYSGNEEYVVLTCYDGAVYANQIVYRGFLSPKADGTFEWSNGAFDNGASRARFENGVLVYEDFSSMSEGSDGNAVYTLNGESIDETAYSAFLDEQAAKDDLAWTEFSVDAVNAALAG